MKKFIGLFLILGTATALLTSCFKAKYYGGRTNIKGGTTINITSSNGIPTNINYTITETQVVQGASFEIKASNAIPVQLKAPTNSWNVQITNPINVQLNQTGAIQATLTISNAPLRFENTNMAVSIGLKFDPAMNRFLTNGFKVTIDTAGLEKALHQAVITNWVIMSGSTNFLNSYKSIIGEKASNENFPLIMSLICIVWGGMIGRTIALSKKEESSNDGKTMEQFTLAVIALCVVFLCGIYKPEGFMFLISDIIVVCSVWRFCKNRGKIIFDGDKIEVGICQSIIGIISALLVPAFARIATSNPLVLSYQDPLSTVAFFTFCVLAGMLGKIFIIGLVDISEGLIKRVTVDVKKLEDDLKKCEENRRHEELRQKFDLLLKRRCGKCCCCRCCCHHFDWRKTFL